jgi:hypothetical protein
MTNISAVRAHPRARRWLLLAAVVVLMLGLAIAVAGRFLMPPAVARPAQLDEATTRLSANGLFRASFSVEAGSVPVNKLHTWTLHVETPDGQPVDNATIRVDGDMPEHGHGMPTQPLVTGALGNGDYRVEGMKFQMGGWWVIDFDITANNQTDRVSFNLVLDE